MNILLAASNLDGPYWLAFNLDSLSLKLEHHKNLYDAIQFCLNYKKKENCNQINVQFGNILFVNFGELCEEYLFVESMLTAEAEFGDEEHEDYDSRYTDITIKPPFNIDIVLTLKTF